MTEDTPASYNEPAPGTYSTDEHLRAQQEQHSAVNDEPLHPELSSDSDLEDPTEVGKKAPKPQDSSTDADPSAEGAHAAK